MNIKLKWVVLVEAIIIVILSASITNFYLDKIKIEKARNQGFLSARVYSGLLEPKSFLITSFAPLKENVLAYIQKNNLNVSVYVENLRNGAFMGINEKNGFFPTSLNKLPVAVLIMKKIEQGEISFDTMLEIKDTDRTDSSGELYKTKEKKLSVRTLLEKLLKDSDNTALRVLLRYIDLEDLQFVLDYYGIDINVDYQKKQQEKNPDLITPKAISGLISSLHFSTVLEPQSSEYLLKLLSESHFNIKEIANLPDDIRVAHKFGDNYYANNKFFHDCGILYTEESRILYCIMTKNLDESTAVETVGVILNQIYNYVISTKSKLKKYEKKI